VGGGEGREGGINGKNIIEEKIPEGNQLSIPLKFNSNSKIVGFGKLRDNRKSHWLRRGLIVAMNEFGKKRVSWDRVNGGKQAGNWVARENNNVQNKTVGLGPCNQKAHATLSKTVGLLGSKESTLGLGLSSPCNFEAGESSISGSHVLETSHRTCLANPSLGRSEIVAGEGGQHSPTRFAPTPTVPIGLEVVAHASHDLISAIGDLSRSMLVSVVSSATMSSTIAPEVMGADGFGGSIYQTQSSTMLVKLVGVV